MATKAPMIQRFRQAMGAIVGPFFGTGIYDNIKTAPHRSEPGGAAPQDAKRSLTPTVRGELVRRSRYINKNSGFFRELVANMQIYAAGNGIKPQARSADKAWNKAAEDYFARWSKACEITGRFSFPEVQALVCRAVDIDGEIFVQKAIDPRTGTAKLQILETHKIGDARNSRETVDGIALDEYGAPLFYRVLQDDGTFNDVPAAQMLHVFEPEDSSAVRNAPTYQHSINHILDEMDLVALEKHAVKDNSDIARVLKKAGRADLGSDSDFALDSDGRPDEPAAGTDPVSIQRLTGGKIVALQEGEDLSTFESQRPSPTFTGFLEHLRRDSALGGVPFEFAADSSKIGGAGVRLVVAKADRRFGWRSYILQEKLVTPVWLFVIGDAIARGLLPAIADWDKISCTSPRRITVDAGREASANRADIECGLKTLDAHFAEMGEDFEEQAEIRAQNAAHLVELAAQYKVPLSMIWNPSGGSEGKLAFWNTPAPEPAPVDPNATAQQ